VKRTTDYDNDPEISGKRLPDRGALDRELDAALAKFATAAPRAGLEERVLANLRAGQEHTVARRWWRWLALDVTVALAIVIAISLVGKPGKPTPNFTARRSAITVQGDKRIGTPVVTNDLGTPMPAHLAGPVATNKPVRHGVRHLQAVIANGPRLDQFPSPRPLSEQEQLLAHFVQEFPEEAAIIARAQAESEKEMEQLTGDQPSGTNSDQQDQQER